MKEHLNPPDLPNWSESFSQIVVVRAGSTRTIYVSGQVSVDADNNVVGHGDLGRSADHEAQVSAFGPAGSIIIYNGSVWHGHTANRSGEFRRSIQGAFIRRDAESAVDQAARMLPETLGRVGSLAK